MAGFDECKSIDLSLMTEQLTFIDTTHSQPPIELNYISSFPLKNKSNWNVTNYKLWLN